MSKLNLAMTYASMSWHVFPVWSVDDNGNCRCGKPNDTPGHKPGKHPHGKLAPHGHNDATTDEDKIRDWWTRDPNAGIGVSLAPSGLLAVDIDPRNGGWESLAEIEVEHVKLQSTCVAQTQGGGEHRLFLADPSMSVPAQLAPGIDLKYNGYICVEGTRGPDGEYRWLKGTNPLEGAKPDDLPPFLRELCEQSTINPKGELIKPGSIAASSELYVDLATALTVIPPEVAYTDWLKVLFGLSRLHDTSRAYALAREWSTQSKNPDHTPQAFDAKWASVMKENSQTSYESIFYMANQHDRKWRQNLTSASTDLWPEVDLSNLELEPVDYLIDGFLARSLMVLVGKPGMGKSTAMMALCAVVAGIHISNCPLSAPAKGRKVIYITEDTTQFKRNMLALHENCGINIKELAEAIVLLPARRVEAQKLIGLKQKVERYTTTTPDGIVLRPWIVFDTISASIHLDDENSNAEVSNALAFLKAEFFESMECSVCLIAHAAKHVNRSDFISDARGAGAWAGDSTLTAGIFEEQGVRYLMLGKRRYSPQHTTLQIKHLSTSVTVTDPYGRDQNLVLDTALLKFVNSQVVDKFVDSAAIRAQELHQRILRQIRDRSSAGLSCSQNSLSDVREQVLAGIGPDRLKSALRQLVNDGLIAKAMGIIGTNSGWDYSLTEAGTKALTQPST